MAIKIKSDRSSIRLSKKAIKELKKFKAHPRESHEEVIFMLIKSHKENHKSKN